MCAMIGLLEDGPDILGKSTTLLQTGGQREAGGWLDAVEAIDMGRTVGDLSHSTRPERSEEESVQLGRRAGVISCFVRWPLM